MRIEPKSLSKAPKVVAPVIVKGSPQLPHLAALLKEARESLGLTLRDVASATGISNAQVSVIENGRVPNPSINSLYRLIKHYSLKWADIDAALAKDLK